VREFNLQRHVGLDIQILFFDSTPPSAIFPLDSPCGLRIHSTDLSLSNLIQQNSPKGKASSTWLRATSTRYYSFGSRADNLVYLDPHNPRPLIPFILEDSVLKFLVPCTYPSFAPSTTIFEFFRKFFFLKLRHTFPFLVFALFISTLSVAFCIRRAGLVLQACLYPKWTTVDIWNGR